MLPVVVPHFQDFFGLDFILFENFLFLFNRFPGPGRSKRLETRHLGAASQQHYAGSARITETVRRQERLGWLAGWLVQMARYNNVQIYAPNMEIEQGHLSKISHKPAVYRPRLVDPPPVC